MKIYFVFFLIGATVAKTASNPESNELLQPINDDHQNNKFESIGKKEFPKQKNVVKSFCLRDPLQKRKYLGDV